MLDEKFISRMESLLGDDFQSFERALECEGPVRAVRVNSIKCSAENFLSEPPFELTPISYASDGFIINPELSVGSTPEHHAGIVYSQDPGAMATLSALEVEAGWWVLDMCAAPGGKSGQAAAKIADSGFLLSNEYVPKRAKIVVSNFERLGIKNAVVTSLDTAELAKMFDSVFNLVIADVPCSGEGMFRKSEEALTDWSEENVLLCAKRQKEILNNAKNLVKGGGYLLYSTCTYSLEENEMVVDDFLSKNPEYSLVRVKNELEKVTEDGILFKGAKSNLLNLTRRFYPHKAKGEGQFIALMKKSENCSKTPTFNYKSALKPLTRDEKSAVDSFFKESLVGNLSLTVGKVGENIVAINHSCPIPQKSVFSAGVLLGSVEKGKLFPSHQFFSAYAALFKRCEELKREDARLSKYLRGEEIDAVTVTENGWCAVTYLGAGLGGGKMSGGKIKNHYPKGLRSKG